LIIALVIAVIGIVTFLSKRSVNPVTGEKQFVDLSPKQEIALGLSAAPEMAAKMGGVLDPGRDPEAALVAQVGKHIVDSSDASKPESPYRESFRFHLLNDPRTINAFALPGGQIFITRGLFDKLANEAQVAGVLGHEIGHVIGRHASEHMAKGKLGGMLATAVGVGASNDRGGYGAVIAAQAANQMLQLKFGRSDESESDRFGLRYMTQAGYDPREMLGVMEVLRDASKSGPTPEFMLTHPLPETRLREIEARIKEMFPEGVPQQLSKGRALR
jgi:predicted Zn-dependent protease